MTGETHKAGGVLCSVAGFLLLKHNGLLLGNVNELLQLGIIYPFCVWASTASDLDHHWESCPTKDVPSLLINKALHATTSAYHAMDTSLSTAQKKGNVTYILLKTLSASHRSWQTHSDLTMFLVGVFIYVILSGSLVGSISPVDNAILSLMAMGIGLGFLAHCILDMLTPEGIHCLLFKGINKVIKRNVLPEKLKFVPKWGCFATGSDWEHFVLLILRVATVVSVVYLFVCMMNPNLLRDLFPYTLSFN